LHSDNVAFGWRERERERNPGMRRRWVDGTQESSSAMIVAYVYMWWTYRSGTCQFGSCESVTVCCVNNIHDTISVKDW
jgi:hypothetical protein